MKEEAFIFTELWFGNLIDRDGEESYGLHRVPRDVPHLDFTSKEDYLNASEEERELQELHAKAVVRNYIRSAEAYVNNGCRLINTITNKVIIVYTRDEVFKEIVSEIYPYLSQRILKNTFNQLELLSECKICKAPFFKETKKTLYCCQECKKEANRSKTLKNYYNKKRSGLNG